MKEEDLKICSTKLDEKRSENNHLQDKIQDLEQENKAK
jgi:hypothetical protein